MNTADLDLLEAFLTSEVSPQLVRKVVKYAEVRGITVGEAANRAIAFGLATIDGGLDSGLADDVESGIADDERSPDV